MTTEEIIKTLRQKQASHGYVDWRMCQEMADALEAEAEKKKAEEDSRKSLKCPYCGGRLSEDRGGYVHCYACHFEFSLENL